MHPDTDCMRKNPFFEKSFPKETYQAEHYSSDVSNGSIPSARMRSQTEALS